jgi:hypothetical protein
MHADTIYELATQRLADDDAYATHQRLVREAREARKTAMATNADPSLLERITAALRKAGQPATRPEAGTA